MSNLTPAQLFSSFKISTNSWEKQLQLGLQAIEEFKAVSDKKPFLKPCIQFLQDEKEDTVRAWGTTILALIGGDQAFGVLSSLLDRKDTQETKRKFLFTRFFALHALNDLSVKEAAAARVEELCNQLWMDQAEDYLVQAEAAAILSLRNQAEPLDFLRKMLSSKKYWQVVRTLRALVEVPVAAMAGSVLNLMKDRSHENLDFRWHAIRSAGSFKNNADISYELGKIAREEPTNYLRLEAVKSLGRLGDPDVIGALLHTLQDDDAEIRCQSAKALTKVLPVEKAALAIIQSALEPEANSGQRTYLVEALRLIDPTRTIPTSILSNELTAEDRSRAEIAEKLLVDLGGWAAVQRLSQRRLTLNRLDNLLSDSEKAVHDMFQGTIRQARFNFYFAMAVNMIIVLTGMILVGIGVSQLLVNPENFASWILPGATGVIGVLINLVFNNPRNNARDDLDVLMNVTVKFFGFLRQLNEIDATFKYLYLEATDFNTERMRETIMEIQGAVARTLQLTSASASSADRGKPSVQPTTPQVPEQTPQLEQLTQ